MDRKPALILSVLLTILVASNYYFFTSFSNKIKESADIIRVIDGDTLVIENFRVIRLENINTPEKGSVGYEEAKYFLMQYENDTIEFEETGTDKYDRTLAKIYAPDYLNFEIVRRGLGNKYLVNEDEVKIFLEAENMAIEEGLGIFKKSKYFDCIEINLDKEIIKIRNVCFLFKITNWTIKDESRKKYKFPDIYLNEVNLHTSDGIDNETDLFWNINNILADRNTLYVFDSEEKFVKYKSFGYF